MDAGRRRKKMFSLLNSIACVLVVVSFGLASLSTVAQEGNRLTVSVLTRGGDEIVGTCKNQTIELGLDEVVSVELRALLSFHSGDPASEYEAKTIDANLGLLGDTVNPGSEIAAATLTDIGLPVMTPLLKGFADTNAKEPDYRYRLFGRIIPGHADALNRSLGLVRLADGRTVRANPRIQEISIQDAKRNRILVKSKDIRRIAVLRDNVKRTFELQSLHHCTYVGFLDTGIITTAQSKLEATAKGYVRLSFDEDGWSTDPHGIVTPLEGKRKLQEGFRWGSVLARVGPNGERWFVGEHIEKSNLGSGRLYFVINDNEHWQNNIGSFRVQLSVDHAFDVGEPF
jgi:hypothetical protein